MERKKIYGKIMPYLMAVICFAAVSAFFFAPQFEGKTLFMHDITQYEGMNRDISQHTEEFGEDPQWTGNMFGGMPSVLISMRQNSMILKWIFPVMDFMGRPASLLFVAMLCFLIMLVMFGIDPWIGIVPSVAYGLSTYFIIIIGAGHITKMVALAYVSLMVGGVYFTLRRNMWLGAALTALFASLQIAANHPQITYYFGLVLIALWINEGIRAYREKGVPRFVKASLLLAAAAILALGSNLAPLWYTSQYAAESIRGSSQLENPDDGGKKRGKGLELDYATNWSYGIGESLNMFIPDFKGGASDTGFSPDGPVAEELSGYGLRNIARHLPTYWGQQPVTSGPTYIGAVIFFLCVLGIILLRGRCKWWILAVSALALMLSWGKNFLPLTELFFNYFPGYDKFRTVSMMLVVLEWSVPFIAALILGKLWKEGIDKKRLLEGIKWSTAITGGTTLMFFLLGRVLFSFESPTDPVIINNLAQSLAAGMSQAGYPENAISEAVTLFGTKVSAAMASERASMLTSDALRTLIFVLLTAAVLWLYAAGKIKKAIVGAALIILVCADLIPVGMRYVPWDKFTEKKNTRILPTQADMQILQDTDPGFRVMNMTVSPFQDATTSYFHRSVGGYHGAKMQRYQDIIDMHLSRNNMQVYNMLNTRYFIVPDYQSGAPAVQFNPDANGAAWFVDTILTVDGPDKEIAALDRIDTKTTAVVDISQGVEGIDFLQTDSTRYLTLTKYKPNRLVYEYSNEYPGIAVFSEIYYRKGWSAFVDGEPADHFRVDYILRGMRLPAGSHTVEFRFRAEKYDLISALTLGFSILILIFVAGTATLAILCNKKKKNDVAG